MQLCGKNGEQVPHLRIDHAGPAVRNALSCYALSYRLVVPTLVEHCTALLNALSTDSLNTALGG